MEDKKLPVYRTIDGKLVRKPNDERDAKRPYAAVADVASGENYLREFTDEEERERDEEERKWEEERPKREAEARQRKDEADRFRASLKYQFRTVAFLDALGWREAVTRSTDDPELTRKLGVALAGLRAHVAMAEQMRGMTPEGWPSDPQVTQFSDSIVFSVLSEPKKNAAGAETLLMSLDFVTHQLLQVGLPVRGAVVRGPLIHQGSIVYGPALTRAYDLEREAKVPRIILDDELAREWGPGLRLSDRDGTFLGMVTAWRHDHDGKVFLNFLRPWAFPYNKMLAVDTKRLALIRQVTVAGLEIERDDIRMKYVWLAQYFNAICEEFSVIDVEKIPLP